MSFENPEKITLHYNLVHVEFLGVIIMKPLKYLWYTCTLEVPSVYRGLNMLMRFVLLSVRSPRAVLLLNINFHLILEAIWDTGHYLVTQP